MAIEDALVSWNQEGGDGESCSRTSEGVFECARQTEGALTVTVDVDGTVQTMDFEIEADDCGNVITQSATFQFEDDSI